MTEHTKARQWRQDVMRLSRRELAERLGVSMSTIVDMESGEHRGKGTPITDAEWQRYRLMCAALTAGLVFDWRSVKAVAMVRQEIDLTP